MNGAVSQTASALVPCTLTSGHYHFGAGALANSLFRNGFRGIMCIGYVPPLPPWCANAQRDNDHAVLKLGQDFELHFIPWHAKRNLSLEKPHFLLHVLDTVAPQAEGVLFFDADVVVHGQWTFFEEWVLQGVALCLDACYPLAPAGHPWRLGWRQLAVEAGYKAVRDLDYYVNSGFIGIPRSARATLQCWARLVDAFFLHRDSMENSVKFDRREQAFVGDQDMLNAALMATTDPLSILGQEGMDFVPAGYTMAHAIDSAKPWRKKFISAALAGHPPSRADKVFWTYAGSPIPLFGQRHIVLVRAAMKAASFIGRFYRCS